MPSKNVFSLTWQPALEGKTASEKILARAVRQGRAAPRGNAQRAESQERYNEQKKARAAARAELLHELDGRECTFAPRLFKAFTSTMSPNAASGASGRGRAAGSPVKRGGTGTRSDPGHEEETFKPKIVARTLERDASAPPAHERLHKSGQELRARRDEEQARLFEQFTQGLPTRAIEADALAGDSGAGPAPRVKRAQEQRARSGGSMCTTLQREQGELTVIEYTTKLDFILEKLNAAHQGESGGGLAATAE